MVDNFTPFISTILMIRSACQFWLYVLKECQCRSKLIRKPRMPCLFKRLYTPPSLMSSGSVSVMMQVDNLVHRRPKVYQIIHITDQADAEIALSTKKLARKMITEPEGDGLALFRINTRDKAKSFLPLLPKPFLLV